MAEEGLTLTAEAEQILAVVRNKENFLLSGGAGSGKTYTLVEVIRGVLAEYPAKSIACITYTNAAVREIEERVDHGSLHVSTIHDFLWDNIKSYQLDLKAALLALILDEDDEFRHFKLPEGIEPTAEIFSSLENGIQYKEYVRLKDGIISHDELLKLACRMYGTHPKLCAITKSRYPFIFVDEYQDTSPDVVTILLDHLKSDPKPCIVGFFGDAMQAIYPDSVGNIDAYKGDAPGFVKEVKKEQNRRNPRLVYELANKIRTDGLVQTHSADMAAPNMEGGAVKSGQIQFIHSTSNDLDEVREFLGWSGETKELNLTHNLIAGKAGFPDFMEAYDGDKILDYVKRIRDFIKDNRIEQDFSEQTFGEVIEHLKVGKTGSELNKVKPTAGMQAYIDDHPDLYQRAICSPFPEIATLYADKEHFLDDKKNDESDLSRPGSQRDNLIKHLFRIQSNIRFYQNGQINDFIRATDFRICSIQDKRDLKSAIESLVNVGDKTVGEIIEQADANGICKIDDRLIRFKENKRYLYDRLILIPFNQFQLLFDYLEGHTPFSTKHKTKGAEYSNVLVILDNGKWNQYNFKSLFEGGGTESVLERTQKIFYVCCTRAKEKLAVFYHDPPPSVLAKAREWFGEVNVIDLDASTEVAK